MSVGHVGPDYGIPVGDDDFLALHQLVIGREDSAADGWDAQDFQITDAEAFLAAAWDSFPLPSEL